MRTQDILPNTSASSSLSYRNMSDVLKVQANPKVKIKDLLFPPGRRGRPKRSDFNIFYTKLRVIKNVIRIIINFQDCDSDAWCSWFWKIICF